MLRIHLWEYIDLGQDLQDALGVFSMNEIESAVQQCALKELHPSEKEGLKSDLLRLKEHCKNLDLPISLKLIESIIEKLPRTKGEMQIIMNAVRAELDVKLFLFIPPHSASFYENDSILSDQAKTAFPSAFKELREAGNAFAAGLNTACVFHSMRAAEIGVKILGNKLTIKLEKPIELCEWGIILKVIDGAINSIQQQPATSERNADLAFYSEAAAQFRFFKNGWRNEVAHAYASYTEAQAKEALEHVRSFFEGLSERLKE